MMDSLKGYLNNIAASDMQTAANGGPLAELADSLVISVNAVAIQQQEIKSLSEQVNALKQKGAFATSGDTFLGGGGYYMHTL